MAEEMTVILDCVIHTLDVHVLSLLSRDLEIDCPERPHFRYPPKEEREDTASKPRLAIHRNPLMLVVAARKIVEKLLSVKVWRILHDHVAAGELRDPGHFRDQCAYAAPVTADGQVNAAENIFEFHTVSLEECTLQQRLGNLEADHVVILVRGIAILGDLNHVETEFGPNVGLGIVAVSNGIAIF